MSEHSLARRIMAIHGQRRDLSSVEIARQVGCGSAYVRAVIRRAGSQLLSANILSRKRHARRKACERAFHDPAGRTIATEDIGEGSAFQMRDLLEKWHWLCTNPQISAETYWSEHPKLIARMEALLSSLKVQGPET